MITARGLSWRVMATARPVSTWSITVAGSFLRRAAVTASTSTSSPRAFRNRRTSAMARLLSGQYTQFGQFGAQWFANLRPRRPSIPSGPSEQRIPRHLPLPEKPQLPLVGGRRARLQHRHLDAAHGAGLDRAGRAHRPERHGSGHRDGAAIRAVAHPAAL